MLGALRPTSLTQLHSTCRTLCYEPRGSTLAVAGDGGGGAEPTISLWNYKGRAGGGAGVEQRVSTCSSVCGGWVGGGGWAYGVV